MDSEDPVLSDDAVLALVRRHVPTAEHVTRVDESGRKGRAYFIDETIVLKTHRPQRLRGRVVEEFETSLEKEAFFLEQIHAASIPCATLLGYGKESRVEYVCMTRVPGVSLRRNGIDTAIRRTALRNLGRVLRRIHSLPQAPMVESGLFPNDGGADQLRAKLEALFAQMVPAIEALPEDWRPRVSVRDAADRALTALPEAPERAALHSNPAGEHVYVDPETGALQGLIDFGDAYIGHPAFDLRPWREPDDRSALIAGYAKPSAPDPSFLAMWRIGLILGELAGVLRRRESPAGADERLTLLLEELS